MTHDLASSAAAAYGRMDLRRDGRRPRLADPCPAPGAVLAVEPGTCFGRLSATIIRFGRPASHARAAAIDAPAESWASLPGVTCVGANLHLAAGDCSVPPRRRFVGSVLVGGMLHVGEGAMVEGDVTARNGVWLSEGAQVRGGVSSPCDVQLLRGAHADGPVLCGGTLQMGARASVGEAGMPTCVRAPVILVESGASAHGTFWARNMGFVWAAG